MDAALEVRRRMTLGGCSKRVDFFVARQPRENERETTERVLSFLVRRERSRSPSVSSSPAPVEEGELGGPAWGDEDCCDMPSRRAATMASTSSCFVK